MPAAMNWPTWPVHAVVVVEEAVADPDRRRGIRHADVRELGPQGVCAHGRGATASRKVKIRAREALGRLGIVVSAF
jgi:hypothetical protein